MTAKIKKIACRVDEKTKQDFIKMANNHGLCESQLLELIINKAINSETEIEILHHGKVLTKTDTDIKQITVRIPSFIMTAAQERAKAQGMATSRWIKSLIQSNLITPPVMIDCAILALEKSDRELAAVGNNLNQIARRLNESIINVESVRIEIIEEVRREVKSVRLAIDELIRVSCNGWSIDNDS